MLILLTVLFLELPATIEKEKNDTAQIVTRVFASFCTFCTLAVVSMGFVRVWRDRLHLKLINTDNLNLFSQIHEGLLVLSESDRSIKFANRPAEFLIQSQDCLEPDQSVFSSEATRNSHIGYEMKQTDFLRPIFRPTIVKQSECED